MNNPRLDEADDDLDGNEGNPVDGLDGWVTK